MLYPNYKVLLGYGTYRSDNVSVEEFVRLLDAAYLAKYDYIDTAFYYKNESQIGSALQILKKKYGSDFHFPVQTKIWPNDYLNTKQAVLIALKKLQVSFLDSVLLHRPSTNLAYDLIAWQELIQLQKAGLIKQIGVSNYDNEMLYFFEKITGVLPKVNQIQMNILNFRFDRYYANARINVNLQGWRPLTFDMKNLETDPVIIDISKKYKTTPTGIAIAFLKALKIDPVVKSANEDRIVANAQAFHNINLKFEDLIKLFSLNRYIDSDEKWGSSTYALTDETVNKLKTEIQQIKNNIN